MDNQTDTIETRITIPTSFRVGSSEMILKQVFSVLGSVTEVVSAPDEPNILYVLKQEGLIQKFNRETGKFDSEPFLDLTDEVSQVYKETPMMVDFPDERGLLSLAFHPEYNTVGSLFHGVFIVLHSELANPEMYEEVFRKETPDPDHMTCLAQYRYDGNTAEVTKKSRMNMLCFPEPQANHNGGGLLFGKDGYLWVGVGDGGGANDEHGPLLDPKLKDSFLGNAQNLQSIHGKILRIEVVQPMPQGVPYAIPQNNPFAGQPKRGRQEIVAWGFRNPWRMSMDSKGQLFVGDVGQNRFEMVKLVTQLGTNYGWRAVEGMEIFNQQVLNWITSQSQKIVPPIITYPREMGIAIVGVEHYEGQRLPELQGKLVITDHGGRIMLGFESEGKWKLESLVNLGIQIRSFNRDQDNELYVSAFDSSNHKAICYRIEARNQSTHHPTNFIPSPKASPNNLNIQPNTQPKMQPNVQPGLTKQDVDQIIKQGVAKALKVKSAFRKDSKNQPTNVMMHFSLIRRGDDKAILVHSMPDAWDGSIDISKKKANTAVSFSSRQNALTSRTIGVASQPGGPLWQIGNSNSVGGIIEFPGGIPLYKNGVLVGAVGVSGDGVDQDEAVAQAAATGFEPPKFIRSDQVIGLPYIKDEAVEELPFTVSLPTAQTTVQPARATVKLVNRSEWEEYTLNNHPGNQSIQLFISGDRQIRMLGPFIPYASEFVSINFFHSSLSSLNGLEKFVNLKSLNLSRTNIKTNQLVYLSGLTGLERLELNGNDITDLSLISKLNPRHLGLACLQITSIQPLASMNNLTILDLYQNSKLENIQALASLTSLKDLDIRQTRIDPTSVRRTLPKLITLIFTVNL